MSTADDAIEAVRAQHRAIAQSMPNAWGPFFERFGSLRPIQLQAMPPILTGENVLVTAPTAGGKTEAVLAPICERLTHHGWPGLSVLVITPTRALVNDLFHRLSTPMRAMRIRLGRKTGDHAFSRRANIQVLITTPESTESLLTFRKESLDNVRAIILDEIHLLDGSPRGDQLRSVLSRLFVYRRHVDESQFAGLQHIAMSATVSDPRRLADVYLGEGASVVSVPGQRNLLSRTLLVTGTDKERAEATIAATGEFAGTSKVLVFVNSRAQVDTHAGNFRAGRFASVPVYGHHGSLSKQRRQAAENEFKNQAQAVCIATMTLEVGIDIGDIDLVVCMDPPFSLSSFLQRIGRGCRRLNGQTRVLCVASDRASELIFNALIRQASAGIPPEPTAPFRRSVLLQQILAYLKQAPGNRRVMSQFVSALSSASRPPVDGDLIEAVLSSMVERGLLVLHNQVYQPASEGRSFIESDRIFSNIEPPPSEITMYDVEISQTVVSVARFPKSPGVRVAGQSYEFLHGGGRAQRLVRGGGDFDKTPGYHARSRPYAFDVGAALANRFGIESNTIVTLQVGGRFLIMTWLGALLNRVLSVGIRRGGCKVTAGSFHLAVEIESPDAVLSLLHETVRDVVDNNPLAEMNLESLIELGPHFKLLSETEQARAREDWLDQSFLTNWIDGLEHVREIDPATPDGVDLVALT